MKKYISEIFQLQNPTHEKISFLDVDVNTDAKLFIDPCLIEIGDDQWSKVANVTMNGYFNKFYETYRKHLGHREKLALFEHTHEINATKLGYGNGHNGKAKTAEGMIKTFKMMDNFIEKGIKLSHPIDLSIFIEDFAEDCLSDMLTNILFKVLNDFTLEQCRIHDFKVNMPSKEYYYWDYIEQTWKKYKGKCLIIDDEVVLLVPKWFVQTRFYYNMGQYFSMMVLEKIQQEKMEAEFNREEQKPPTKKSLKAEFKNANKSARMVSLEYTEIHPNIIGEYHKKIPASYKARIMPDEVLDRILYGQVG